MSFRLAVLLAEACRMYGWTVEYVLGMPARRFFAMLEAGRELKAQDRADDCDIAAIPMCNAEYHQQVRDRFSKKFDHSWIDEVPDEVIEQLDGVAAQNAMIGLF